MSYVSNGGVRLFYSEAGDGPSVLWHTGGCGDATMWETAGYISALPGFRHILFDHRGHGRSDHPDDIASQPMDLYVDDVVAVLDAAGLERSAMVGYSQGARIAYATAMRHPERMSAVVGLDSLPGETEDPADFRSGTDEVLRAGTRAVIETMARHESEPPPRWLVEHLCTTTAQAFAGAYACFATMGDFWAALPSLATPVLFLVAVDEPGDEREQLARKAAELAARGSFATLPGLGHLQAFWRTDLSIPPIAHFLAAHACEE